VEYKSQILDELEKLASFLDIPFARRRDYRWIMRNVAINNTDNKNIKKVITICQLLMKDETNG
jgi:signal recognition particle subunit SEC65